MDRSREDGVVKNETLGNLSHLPDALIDIIRRSLQGESFVPLGQAFEVVRSRAHGPAQAVALTLQRLGFASVIASNPCRERDLVLAMLASRIVAPHTKLATTRWWHTTTLAEDFGVADASEDDLYAAMDWLLARQGAIQNRLAVRHLSAGGFVLIAAHYGSVSVVTFAVGSTYLARLGEAVEGYMTVFLVLLEFPALVIGVLLARGGQYNLAWGPVLREVFAGKSLVLLLGGMAIGWVAGPGGIAPLDQVFFDLFKGLLAFFLLEMGLVAASRFGDLRRAGFFLVAFAILMPLAAAGLGLITGALLGLSVSGITLLATLYASASYIAAPATMRIAVPEANPALSIGAALGITFPFNLIVGIPLYHRLAQTLHHAGA